MIIMNKTNTKQTPRSTCMENEVVVQTSGNIKTEYFGKTSLMHDVVCPDIRHISAQCNCN